MCNGSRLKTVALAFNAFFGSNSVQMTGRSCPRYLQMNLHLSEPARMPSPARSH
jgi:hypothetical protein